MTKESVGKRKGIEANNQTGAEVKINVSNISNNEDRQWHLLQWKLLLFEKNGNIVTRISTESCLSDDKISWNNIV